MATREFAPLVIRGSRVLCLGVLASALAGSRLRAESTPVEGTARIGITADPGSLAVGSTTQAFLAIDLSSVTGKGAAAALGAYVVEVTFDKSVLEFVSAAGGTTTGFTAAPTVTPPAQANGSGRVIVVAVSSQLADASATGLSRVAVLSFRSLAPGTATLTAVPSSLASSGAASIPAIGNSATLRVESQSRSPREQRQPRTVPPRASR